jgi:glutamyl-tRNA reductase
MLADVDDLQSVADRNRKVRQAEARKAEGIIEEEIQQFATWLGSLEVLPTLAALRAHAADIAELVVGENAGKWESASPRDLERIEAMARSVINRLLHEPTVRIKEMRDDRVHARMALIRELFDLTTVQETAAQSPPGRVAEVRELPSRAAARGGSPPT